ncbi:uncharacterized protein LOC109908065 isoform X1 [Oncorhynchus kisutch]|nr:uncharacterized protein LOC109908065 isoform X1 [Oncorhynchus kisutch]
MDNTSSSTREVESVFLNKHMLGYDSEDSISNIEIKEYEYVPGTESDSESSLEDFTALKDKCTTKARSAPKDGQLDKDLLGYDSEDSISSIEITEYEYVPEYKYVPGTESDSESSLEDFTALKDKCTTKARLEPKDGQLDKDRIGYNSEDSISSTEITRDECVSRTESDSESSLEHCTVLKNKGPTKARSAPKDGPKKTYKRHRNTESDTSVQESTSSLEVMHVTKTKDGSRRYTKKHYCLFCEKPQSKIARHLEMIHKSEAEVAKALSFPKNSKDRKLQLTILRKRGDRAHNMQVIREGKGVIVPCKQTSSPNGNPKDFLHCANCQGLFKRKFLWKHMKRCPLSGVRLKPGKTRVQAICAHAQPVPDGISKGLWKLVNDMTQDEVVDVIKRDKCIIQFGEQHYNIMGHRRANHELIRQKMRELGRLVLKGKHVSPLTRLEEYIDPANFLHTISAVKAVCGFDSDKNTLKTPSLALKLGHNLQKVADIVSCEARVSGNKKKAQKVEDFKHIYKTCWREYISCHAHKTFEENKFNAPLILTFAEDVKKLHIHLQEKQKTCYSQLSKEPNRKTWAQLAKVTLSQMTVFNRKRLGDASLMTVASFVSRDKTALHDDYGNSLSDVERALCQHFSCIEIRGKRSRKVTVLLSPTMIKSMELLAEKREHCSVLKENIYMFAIPGCPTSFSGSDCLRLFAKKCGAKCPESLSSIKLRKHITMMSTVLNLNDNDMDLLADFLGHDLQMDNKYYRLPEGTLQLAKITKVLMAMEQGRLNEFKGKGLDQIHISPVECVELDEESDTDLTEETPGRSCEPQERTREAMAGRSGSKKRKWSEEDKGPVEETYIQFMDSGATPGNADSCMHQGSATSPQRAGLAGSEVLCQEQNYSTCEQDYQ